MFEFIDTKNGSEVSFDVIWKRRDGEARENITLVLGGPKGGSGKTTLTLVAATAIAARGAKVLLIDATEAQGHLTSRFAPDTTVDGSPTQDEGFGELIRTVKSAVVRSPELPYRDLLALGQEAANNFFWKVTKREEELGRNPFLRRLSVDPNSDATMDFLPCASVWILEALRDYYLATYATVRQAIIRSVLDGLIKHYGGWDYILIDILPSPASLMVRGVLGVADRMAIVVDTKSSGPLAGMEETVGDLRDIRKQVHRPNPTLMAGFILNKVNPGNDEEQVIRTERLEIVAFGQKHGIRVIGEVREMTSLTMLGFNQQAVKWLQNFFGGKIPGATEVEALVAEGGLSDEQIQAISTFQSPSEFYLETGQQDVQVGVRHLVAQSFGPNRRKLIAEERAIVPTVLALAGENAVLKEWDARAAEAEAAIEKGGK